MKSNYSFIPKSTIGSKFPKNESQECFGTDLRFQDNYLTEINLNWLIECYKNCPEKENFFNSFFDKLAGTNKLKMQVISGKTPKEIRRSWKRELEKFKRTRIKYLIYN